MTIHDLSSATASMRLFHPVREGRESPSARLAPVAPAMADPADPRLARILRHIDQHLDDPDLDTGRLQRRFAVSRPTLYRIFRPLGGVSRYIRERRLLAAHQRLRSDPERSITFLLYDLGFESERQFQRAFLAYFGMSPAEWRDRCRAAAAARRPPAGAARAGGPAAIAHG